MLLIKAKVWEALFLHTETAGKWNAEHWNLYHFRCKSPNFRMLYLFPAPPVHSCLERILYSIMGQGHTSIILPFSISKRLISPTELGHPQSVSLCFWSFGLCFIGEYFHHFESPWNLKSMSPIYFYKSLSQFLTWVWTDTSLLLCLNVLSSCFPNSDIIGKCVKCPLTCSLLPSLQPKSSIPTFHYL